MNNTHNKIERNYTIEDLEELLDKIPYEVWLKDENGKIKYANKLYASIIGMEKEEVIGKTDFDFRPYDIAKRYSDGDKKVLNSTAGILSEEKVIINNEEKWYETYKSSFERRNKKENSRLVAGIAREISIDKILQNEIINSFFCSIYNSDKFDAHEIELKIIRKLKDRISAEEIAVYLYNSDENEMFLDVQTGSDDSDFKDTYSISYEDRKAFLMNRYNRVVLEDNKKYIYPIKIDDCFLGTIEIHYDGEREYFQEDIIVYTCIVMSIILYNRNLSVSLNKELAKRNSIKKKLQMVINTGIDAYALLKVNGDNLKWIDMSRRCTEVFGWNCETMNKVSINEMIHPDDRSRLKNIRDKKVREYRNFECRVLCKNEEYKYIELSWSYVNEDTCVVTAKDVTRENELKIDKEDLQEAVEIESLKTEFFANLSHEFKTPLNIILSAVQMLNYLINNKENIERDQLNKYINGIKQNSYRLLKLANNMIDITKIDGGFYEIEIDNCNIVEVVENIVLSAAEYMRNNKRNITFDTTEEEIITACDPDQIERIILNLLSNSLKFTSINGNIYVNMSISDDCRRVIIKVRNDGEPVSREFAKKIFKRFTQSENLLTRSNEGSGIGLSLVKSLVEIHNGRIYVNTEIEYGTEFCIEIPIRKLKNNKNKNVLNRNINSKVQKYRVEFSDIYSLE
ncbi:MAG: ATP-binding protein [Clostridium sp.]|nr:ATP-binding protein [Clostridium sp.]